MGKVLIIGAGGVANVVVGKCAQAPDVFSDICVASRTIEKCETIRKRVLSTSGKEICTETVDADHVNEVVELIRKTKPDLLVNVALPYQDLSIMEACLITGVNYLDTANYESPDEARFEYGPQWAYHDRFREKGILAVLGCGFDPGVTNVFCAHAQKHLFDSIRYIDILDANAGDHGHPFATNFNPEINIREVTQVVRHWNRGEWIQTPPILEPGCVHFTFDYPEAGPRESYLLYHEEMESLVRHIRGLERIRFWMTFSEPYLTHLKVLQNVGMTRIDEVIFEGRPIIPIRFLKALLPDPGSLGATYSGKTVIGCIFDGMKDGNPKKEYIYNVCDHSECYRETGAQAVSYTTGVPAMIGAMLVMKGVWKGKGVFNVEQFDPDPFMEALSQWGLPWHQVPFSGNLPA